MPALRPIRLGAPGEDIPKKDLLAVVRRFQTLHAQQLRRIRDLQTPRQRDFLDSLPLLFHCNHPRLPGYVSAETPAGIPDYHPSRATLQAAERLSKSFEFKKRALSTHPIEALYLMGSIASLAYSQNSDLDIWLCLTGRLAAAELSALRQKAAGVEAWAQTLGLEAHIFFIDTEQFRRGVGLPISTESCGSIQHRFLLEEFYRTGLWLAGKIPAWWLVPPDRDRDYTGYLGHLRDKRFVNPQDIIDFGSLEEVPPSEFIGGTLWHLHKASSAPHKSLLKLLLLESYAHDYPHIDWLCTRLKAAVYGGTVEPADVDPYILMYRKVEQYLTSRHETDRLELARDCLYLKINEAGARRAGGEEKQYRRETLAKLTQSWGWQANRLRELGTRHRWKLDHFLEEQKRIGAELGRSYESVRRLAGEYQEHHAASGEEIRLLGRKLAAVLERKPGKVERLFLDAAHCIEPRELTLREIVLADGDEGWALFVRQVPGPSVLADEPIKRARSLLEVLAWVVGNGLYRRSMTVALEAKRGTLSEGELRRALNTLADFFENHGLGSHELEVYTQPARIESSLLFVNFGHGHEMSRQGSLYRASSRFDALAYGHNQTNLIEYVDALWVTTWGEWLVSRYVGLSGLLHCLCEILNQSGARSAALECHCFSDSHARTIALRVAQLHQAMVQLFFPAGSARYVIRGDAAIHLLEKRDDAVRFWRVPSPARLEAELGEPRKAFTATAFDPNALPESPLPVIYGENRPHLVQVFCLQSLSQADVYVLDERGSLFHGVHPAIDVQLLISPYVRFLTAVARRYVLTNRGFEYYRVHRMQGDRYTLEPLHLRPERAERRIDVRVFASERAQGEHAYAIYCQDREFSSLDTGRDVFARAAAHILSLRASGESYPIYITDVDVPLSILSVTTPEELQSIHLLRYKRKIENRLNG